MKLNCRPGDLAIVVKSAAGHEGKILTCLRYIGPVPGYSHKDNWEVDRALPGTLGGMDPIFPDSYLRPLRGDDLSQEIASAEKQAV